MDIAQAAKIARSDLCLALSPDGGVCPEWRDRLEQSVRLITEALGDQESFTQVLISWKMNPLILDKEYSYKPKR